MCEVWLDKESLSDMINEGQLKSPLETGGCLMGYIADNQDIVITEIIGPGSNAKHEPYNFEGDYDYHTSEVGKIYDESGRTITYLGDWHTHPKSSPQLSDLDIQCLENIAKNQESRCPNPVMLVLGYDFDMIGVYSHSEPRKSLNINRF
jgi:integrative and conjugative element protein (TIGR02256 family)